MDAIASLRQLSSGFWRRLRRLEKKSEPHAGKQSVDTHQFIAVPRQPVNNKANPLIKSQGVERFPIIFRQPNRMTKLQWSSTTAILSTDRARRQCPNLFRWVRRCRGARRCRSTAATKQGYYLRRALHPSCGAMLRAPTQANTICVVVAFSSQPRVGSAVTDEMSLFEIWRPRVFGLLTSICDGAQVCWLIFWCGAGL